MNRLTLKDWSRLDDIRQKIESEAEAGRWQIIPNLIIESILLCGGEVEDPPWMEVDELYQEVIVLNQPRIKFPIFSSKEKSKRVPWEYQGRTWYFWLNLFASKYGWSAQEVGEMDLDDACGLFEEISVDSQMEREWQYGLSEFAYDKKGKFRSLGRPDWMAKHEYKEGKIKKTMIPKSAMPVGNIVFLDET